MRQTKCFVILGHFLPFHPLNNPENQNFEKIKNASRDVIILHLCIKNHNQSRCMLSEIWSVTNNFLSFWTIVCPYTSLLTPKVKIWKNCKKIRGRIILLHKFTLNEGHMMYGSWDIRHNGQFFVILGHFLPFDAPNPKNQNFEKIKKMKKKKKPGDIIILLLCTTNDNHMMYCSWDMERDRLNFLSFWMIFCPFSPVTTPNIKILKKRKK